MQPSDLVLFQLKTSLQKFKKSLQKKNIKNNLKLESNFMFFSVCQPAQGSGPYWILITITFAEY